MLHTPAQVSSTPTVAPVGETLRLSCSSDETPVSRIPLTSLRVDLLHRARWLIYSGAWVSARNLQRRLENEPCCDEYDPPAAARYQISRLAQEDQEENASDPLTNVLRPRDAVCLTRDARLRREKWLGCSVINC
jgi:hypothetical protein